MPPNGKAVKCGERARVVELKPYGSTRIRMAQFPVVDLSSGSRALVDFEGDGGDEREEL